ncbi:MAG: SH3 domain-containing protein [Phaeodactylibacter sp.]|uniref:SH3 domain-containing protein n=1 Tax=Phaeodactylibacter sp. TaxID=1940289 RepID=UPI0032EF3C53
MKERFLLLGFMGLLFAGCSQAPSDEEAGSGAVAQPQDTLRVSRYPTAQLSVPVFQIREAPLVDSRSLGDLRQGEQLELLGPVSENSTRLTIGGQAFLQPWLLVRTVSGVEGWVHAAALGDEMPDGLRLQAFLGKDLAATATAYRQSFTEMGNAATVVQALRQAHQLAGVLSIALQPRHLDVAPKVADLLPALTAVWMETRRSWLFFVDYKAFETAAQRSQGIADEALLKLYYDTYPVDSIGYVHPAWKLEVEPDKVYSLLGKGMHFSYLEHLDQMLKYHDVAGPEIDQLKVLIINDMTAPSVLYWEAREKVWAELEAILDTTFLVLKPADTLALHQSMESIRDTGVAQRRRFNFRAGF